MDRVDDAPSGLEPTQAEDALPRDAAATSAGPPDRTGARDRGRSGGDERRRRRGGGSERVAAEGFRDGIERAFCAASVHVLPETFPVQSRPGIATRWPVVVDQRPDARLYCDGSHDGPHLWPVSDPVHMAERDDVKRSAAPLADTDNELPPAERAPVE